MAANFEANFPPEFIKFLTENEINPEVFKHAFTISRFIRLNPNNLIDIAEVEQQLNESHSFKVKIEPTALNHFFSVDAKAKIAHTNAYKCGQIYGMDFASGACVMALDPRENESILDLCCAPGAKLCMISDLLKGTGSVTGVDVATERLAACKSVVEKYKCNVKLHLHDGRLFNEGPAILNKVSNSSSIEETVDNTKDKSVDETCNDISRDSVIGKKRGVKQIKLSDSSNIETNCNIPISLIESLPLPEILYDKVLVDTECTHDGSIRHIIKYNNGEWNTDTFVPRVLDGNRLAALQDLQRALLFNGFRLTKPGGLVIYSTCSFCVSQNENIVQWLLSVTDKALLLDFSEEERLKLGSPAYSQKLPGTLRFCPLSTNSSALYVARIRKLM